MGADLPLCDLPTAGAGALFTVLCAALGALLVAAIAAGFALLRRADRAAGTVRMRRRRPGVGGDACGLPDAWRLYRQLGPSGRPAAPLPVALAARGVAEGDG